MILHNKRVSKTIGRWLKLPPRRHPLLPIRLSRPPVCPTAMPVFLGRVPRGSMLKSFGRVPRRAIVADVIEADGQRIPSLKGCRVENYEQHCAARRREADEKDRRFLTDRSTQQDFLRSPDLSDCRVGNMLVRDMPVLMPGAICEGCQACRPLADFVCGKCRSPHFFS